MDYLSLQGKLLVATRNAAGLPGAFRWVGDMSDVTFSAEEDKTDYRENYSGNRNLALTLTRGISGRVSGRFLQVDLANFNLLFRGETVTQTGGSITNETLGDAAHTLAIGDIFALANQDVSALTLEDSAGTPKTLTAGTNYSLNAKVGSIEILDVTTGGPFTMPLVADYTAAAALSRTKMFTAGSAEYWLRFEGINTAVAGNPKVLVEFYKAQPSPLRGLPLVNPERAEIDVEFSVLSDTDKTVAGDFGQLGRLILLS